MKTRTEALVTCDATGIVNRLTRSYFAKNGVKLRLLTRQNKIYWNLLRYFHNECETNCGSENQTS